MITNYVLKVIRSCKTIEQLDSCEKWINNIKYKQITSTSIFAEFVWILDMRQVINSHKKRLTVGK